MSVVSRFQGVPKIPYRPNPAAGDAFEQNTGLRQRNAADSAAAYNRVDETFGDPMHAQALNNASQNLINARTDVTGMGAVLQGIHEAATQRDKKPRIGFQEQDLDAPSAKMPASWNPAGQTEDASIAEAQKFATGQAPLPDWYQNAAPDSQEAFRRRVLQGIRGARV